MTDERNLPDKTENQNLTDAQIKLKRRNEGVRVVKFVLLSASAGIIQLVSFTLLNELVFGATQTGVGYWLPYLISLVLSVIWNFTFNRKFTFKSAANVPKAMFLVFLYYCVFTPLSTWGGSELEGIGWNEYIVLAISMLLNMVTEFLYTRFVVYHNSLNTNDLGKKEEAAVRAAGNGSESDNGKQTAVDKDTVEIDQKIY